MKTLDFKGISHGAFGDGKADDLNLKCVRYFRLEKRAVVSTVRIYPVITRRCGYAQLDGQPAHIIIERFCERSGSQGETGSWELIKEVNLPRFDGKAPHCISLDGTETDLLRIICDAEHPLERTHGEYFASPAAVPVRILNKVEFLGEELTDTYEPEYNPPMKKREIAPGGIPDMDIRVRSHEITYSSRYFKVVFSLRRPLIRSMGYDCLGKGNTAMNVLNSGSVWINGDNLRGNDTISCITGPKFINARHNTDGQLFTGEVTVKDDYVLYENVRFNGYFSMDIRFTVSEKGLRISIRKKCHQDYTAIESDDFRFVLDCRKTISGIQGVPEVHRSRVGMVKMPAVLCSPGQGSLDITSLDGSDHHIQTDDYKDYGGMSWFSPTVGGERDEYGFLSFRKGEYSADFEMKIGGVMPELRDGVGYDDIHDGFKLGLTAALAFRADFVGFSNNFLSGNCHLSQYHIADMAPYFRKARNGMDVAQLLRFTIECSLRNGPGYGDCRELFIDSDPSVLIAAARVYQLLRDREWLVRYWNRIKEAIGRVAVNVEEDGLLKCTALTGNSGSKKWSCNAWDVINFGHYDAYTNVLAYRAFRNAAVLADVAGDGETAAVCREKADIIQRNYERILLNPDTGVVSGWVSADGQHHDYMFPFINAMAICCGLIRPERAKSILGTFMDRFREMGLDYFYYGLPVNLLSIRNEDVPAGDDFLREDGLDRFGIYLNGSLSPIWNFYFIRALEMYGMEEEADRISNDLLDTFASDTFYGGYWSGTEFFTWQGQPCAYEGPLVGMFPVLAAIAFRKGIMEPIKDEWWLS